MKKLFLTVLSIFVVMCMVSTASAWSWTTNSNSYTGWAPKSISSNSFSSAGSYTSASSYAGTSAYGCSACVQLETSASTYSASGPGWFSASASASASSSVLDGIVCDEPSACDDAGGDGICGEPPDVDPSSCESTDLDCLLEEACPCDADWENHGKYVVCVGAFERAHRGEPGIGDVVSDAGCSNCGGSHVGAGCDDDDDGVTNTLDECADTPTDVAVNDVGCPIDYSRCFTLEGVAGSIGGLIAPGTPVAYEICTDEERGGGYWSGPPPLTFINQGPTYGYYWAELISFPMVGTVDMSPRQHFGDHSPGNIWVGVATDDVRITGTDLLPSEWVIGTPRQIQHRGGTGVGGLGLGVFVDATVTNITDY